MKEPKKNKCTCNPMYPEYWVPYKGSNGAVPTICSNNCIHLKNNIDDIRSRLEYQEKSFFEKILS